MDVFGQFTLKRKEKHRKFKRDKINAHSDNEEDSDSLKTDTGDENEIKDSNLMDPKLDRKVLEDDLRIFRQFRKFAGEDLMTQHELEG